MAETSSAGSSKPFDPSLLSPPDKYPTRPSPQLSEEVLEKLRKITEHFSKDGFELPVSEENTIDKKMLSEREMMFLSKETFLRFLTATKGDVTAAIQRLEGAVIWRRTADIENVEAMAADCEPESRSGKNIVMGFTPLRRPIIYFFPNRNTTPVDQRRAVHAIFLLERARDLMPAGVMNVMVIFNFSGKREGPPTNVSVARQVLNILSSHYPETLASSVFQNMPWVVKAFVNLMWPFVDPATKKKVKFDNAEDGTLVKNGEVDAEYLLTPCGGDLDMPYHHETYWKTLVDTCLKVREAQEEAFRKGPKMVGREEREWRRESGATGSVNDSTGHVQSGTESQGDATEHNMD